MSGKIRFVYAAGVIAVAAVIVISLLVSRAPDAIRGAILISDPDRSRELPIGNVEVTIIGGPATSSTKSDTSGYFSLPIPWHLRRGQGIGVEFHHPDYQPLELSDVRGDRICIARLLRRESTTPPVSRGDVVSIANVVVKYTISTTTSANVGSAVKTFQVANSGNVPCTGRKPCSPDGKWQAAEGSAVIDAGPGNEFRNARVSCIAGPCPFTKIEGDGVSVSHDNRTVRVVALNWSDTTSFLLEAEVYKPMVGDVLRHSYPLIFDRALTFTLPPEAEGVSIQAELDGAMIVFPLGPSLYLSWADCQLLVNKDRTKVYRCELKPGFRFS